MTRALFTLLWFTGTISAQFRLATSTLSVELNPEIGYGIAHLRDIPAARDYISTETKLPLYRLVLSREDGSALEITSAQAGSVATQRTDNGASLTFEHPDHKLTIICTVRAEPASSRLAWKIAIRNTGPLGVRSVFYPQWAAPLHLLKGESRLLFPFLDGQEFIEPGKYLPEGGGKRMQYPGQAATANARLSRR